MKGNQLPKNITKAKQLEPQTPLFSTYINLRCKAQVIIRLLISTLLDHKVWFVFPFFITIPYGVMLLLSSNAKSIMIHTVRLKVFLFVQTNKKHDIDNLFNSMPNLYAFFFIIINEHFYLIFDRNIFIYLT